MESGLRWPYYCRDATVTDRTPYVLHSLPTGRAESDCACSLGASLPEVLYTLPSRNHCSDCACSESAGSPGKGSLVAGATWRLPPDLYRASLSAGHEVAFRPSAPAGVAVLNEAASRVLDSFAHPRPLDRASSLSLPYPPESALFVAQQLAALGLLVPTRAAERVVARLRPILTVWLHLTTRCNLRCAYCYAPRGGVDMPPDVGRAAVDAALRSARAHGFTAVKIKYAGGEPTLNFPTVQAVHAHARRQAARAGIDLHEVLLSNGVGLTNPMLAWLREEGIRLALSLDGMDSAHDQQRPRTGGQGSSDAVATTVDRARAIGISPHLSVTVTRYNVDALPEVVAFALDRGLTFNLNFVRPVPGAPNLMPPTDRLIAALRAVVELMEQRPPAQRIIDGLLDRCDFTGPHRYPCGMGRSYLVVGPKGAVARCHMEIQAGVSTVWDEDPLAAVQAVSEGVRNLPVEAKDGCSKCPWRYVCAGGCPLLVRRVTGREDVRSPYCEVYRAILPELVRAEGTRLLRRSE